jgi:nitrogen-specific signal transduction histidine kinase
MEATDTSLRAFAHDIRNYLSAIHGYSQVLELRLGQKGMAEEVRFAKEIIRGATKIEELLRATVDPLRLDGRSFAARR